MQVNDVIGAIVIGAVVGTLGRLVLPGKQRIGVFLTLVIGVGAALLGGFVARTLNVDTKAPVTFAGVNWDWIVLGIQVGFALVFTAIAAAIANSRVATKDTTKKRSRSRS